MDSKENLYDFKHPETQEGEVFFSNASEVGFPLIPFQTKRKGKLTFDGRGNQFKANKWFPVFIESKELKAQHKDLIIARREFQNIL